MARRQWNLRFKCGHEGCTEHSNYNYDTLRDREGSHELKTYSNGRWRCTRHMAVSEVLAQGNLSTEKILVVEQREHGRFFGNWGLVAGPGFKAFAEDLPPGTKLIVSARIELPELTRQPEMMKEDSDGSG